MGTNYYGRIIPSKECKQQLKELIDSDNFTEIRNNVDKMYGSFNEMFQPDFIPSGEIHLGKHSAGWKFLWNPNIYIVRNGHLEWTDNGNGSKSGKWISEPNTAFYLYPLTKEGIKSFIDRKDVEIYDEYGEKQDKEIFFQEAINCITWRERETWDSKSYTEYERSKNPNWRIYKCCGEYIDLLEKEGFQFISEDKSDFYSDGLRFASNTNFC